MLINSEVVAPSTLIKHRSDRATAGSVFSLHHHAGPKNSIANSFRVATNEGAPVLLQVSKANPVLKFANTFGVSLNTWESHAWSINDRGERRLIDLEIAGIITDFPDLLTSELDSSGGVLK